MEVSRLCEGRKHEAMLCDNLALPYRDGVFDAVISIGAYTTLPGGGYRGGERTRDRIQGLRGHRPCTGAVRVHRAGCRLLEISSKLQGLEEDKGQGTWAVRGRGAGHRGCERTRCSVRGK